MEKRLLIGLGTAPWERICRLEETGRLPFLRFLRRNAECGPVRFDPPHLPVAWWATVANGQPAGDHGLWSDDSQNLRFSRTTGDGWPPLVSPVWEMQRRCGRPTAVLDWPGASLYPEIPDLLVGESFFHGENSAVAGILPAPIAELRMRPDEIHEDVLTALVPRWRECSAWPAVGFLRQALSRLYTTHRLAVAASTPGSFVAVRYRFLTSIELEFGRRADQWDRREKEVLGGIVERALDLQEILLADLLGRVGDTSQFIVVSEPSPSDPAGPWRSREALAVRSAGLPRPGTVDGAWPAASLTETWRPDATGNEVRRMEERPAIQLGGLPKAEADGWGAAALAAVERWPEAARLAERAWRAHPEKRELAIEAARALQKIGALELAAEALETVRDHGAIPDWAAACVSGLPEVSVEEAILSAVVPVGNLLERMHFFAGQPARMHAPEYLAIIAPQTVARIVGAVALESTNDGRAGRAQFSVASRWRSNRRVSDLLVGSVDEFAARRGWSSWRAEISDADLLAESFRALGLREVRCDERWRVSYARLLSRVSSAWAKLQRRYDPTRWRLLAGRPSARHWEQALALAEERGLADPRLRDALAHPEGFSPELSEFVFQGDDLAAVVLGRQMSPARSFIALRAVAANYDAESSVLNARVMLGPLLRGVDAGFDTLDFFARRQQEAESVSMARRSGGVCLSRRMVMERVF